MDFISEEFFAARTGEALEARLRGSEAFWQQMMGLHEASKAFSKESGIPKKYWKLYDRLEDEWTKYNILYGEDEMYECLTDILDNSEIVPEEHAKRLAGAVVA